MLFAAGPDKKLWIVGDVLQEFDPIVEATDKEMRMTHTYEDRVRVRE
ncbi:MAG TPA: hypothetical protein VII69_11470 [Candidatus Eremiobacteraceae bacterium]